MVDEARLEPIEPGGTCVWCWGEVASDQPALELGEGARAHLACDSRMLNFIESLKEWTDD